MADERWRNFPDASEARGEKFKRACQVVEQQLNDRWPARGTTGYRTNHEWPPLDQVSRDGRLVDYKKYPNAKG